MLLAPRVAARVRSPAGGIALLFKYLRISWLRLRPRGRHIRRETLKIGGRARAAPGQFVKAMLADLGEAKQVVVFGTRAAQSLGSVGVGTLIYMAPEMKEQDEMKGPKVDVFTLGVTATEIATGSLGSVTAIIAHTAHSRSHLQLSQSLPLATRAT